jgi:hypothetical protein
MRITSGGNVGIGTTSPEGILEVGDISTGAGGMFFKVFSMSQATATTFFTTTENQWAGLVEVAWNATDDTNRSGYQLSRFAYDDEFTSLIASSQNSTITLSASVPSPAGEIALQVSITGAAWTTYRVKIRMMGGLRG